MSISIDNAGEVSSRLIFDAADDSARVESAIPPRTGSDPLPLSYLQERLWYLDQIQPGTPAAHVSKAFKLSGPLRVDTLQQSFDVLVERHEALRATFAVTQLYAGVDGRPAQLVSPRSSLEVSTA